MEEESKIADRHIKEWIRFACECNEVPELAQVIVVEWNPRFTRRLGDAGYSPITYRARIRLSIPLWPRASEQDRRETVIHETCHLIVGFKHGFGPAAHGCRVETGDEELWCRTAAAPQLLIELGWLDDNGDSSSLIVRMKASKGSAGALPGNTTGCVGDRSSGAGTAASTSIGSRLSKRSG